MGLDGYRTYRQDYIDSGEQIPAITISSENFEPDFRNSNTLQVWNISANINEVHINKWIGETLADRSFHTIQIFNNAGIYDIEVFFDNSYLLEDDTKDFSPYTPVDPVKDSITMKPGDIAFFYATALNIGNNLILSLRKGSIDNR